MPLDPSAVEADLAAFYDAEDDRASRAMDPRRLEARAAFVASLPPAQRVVEIGCGPGREAPAFVDAGHGYVGLDLSFGHAQRCRATGMPVVQASVRRLPLATASVDAVWTMSTLMHVPDGAIDHALDEIRRVLAGGGVLAVGVWGGADHVSTDPGGRLFDRRRDERWRALLARVGDVESFQRWTYDEGDWDYQYAIVRRSALP